MSRKTPVQSTPHYGVKNGLTRKGVNIYHPDVKGFDEDGGSILKPGPIDTYKSIGQAKRVMRTGKPGADPKPVKPASTRTTVRKTAQWARGTQ
jgi:hypothetical protein